MKPTFHEFCYWLQGAIEIGEFKEITPEKKALIVHMLALVEDKRPFILAVKAILEFYPTDTGFAAICEELQEIFQHYIDPSYEGDQEFYYAVHKGEVVPK